MVVCSYVPRQFPKFSNSAKPDRHPIRYSVRLKNLSIRILGVSRYIHIQKRHQTLFDLNSQKKRKNTNSKIKNSYIIAWLIFKVINLAYKKYFVLTFTYCHIYNLIFLKYNVLPKLNSTLEKRSPKQSHKNICERQVNETED